MLTAGYTAEEAQQAVSLAVDRWGRSHPPVAAVQGGAVPPVRLLLRAHERIGYWLFGIALRVARDYRRTARRKGALPIEDADLRAGFLDILGAIRRERFLIGFLRIFQFCFLIVKYFLSFVA